ncbi:MAG: hypothetical protein ACKVZ0_12500 [Gemmatimonadales bacterium]
MTWLLLVIYFLGQSAERELVELAAAREVRRYADLTGDVLFEPRVPDGDEWAVRRSAEQVRLLAELTHASLADWDVQFACKPPPPEGCFLRDGIPIFLLTGPTIVGDSASVTVKTRRPSRGGRGRTYALDVEIILRKVEGRWVVVGPGQYRAT